MHWFTRCPRCQFAVTKSPLSTPSRPHDAVLAMRTMRQRVAAASIDTENARTIL
jgi:hypothetical protein